MGQRKQMKNFIGFVNERQEIYERRRKGDPYPWTRNRILRKYRFCNVFRHLDRGSQDFLELAAPGSVDPLHALFRAALWTGFNKGETWRRLTAVVDLDEWNKPDDLMREMVPILHGRVDDLRNAHVTMFSHAYRQPLRWNRHGDTLSKAVINLMATLVGNKDITNEFIDAENLFDASSALTKFNEIGNFYAWQITINVWWTKAFQFYDDDRALIGAGSLAGLRLLNGGGYKAHHVFAQALEACRKYGPQYGAMRAIDVEHALCEWNKYVNLQERIRRGEKTFTDRLYKYEQPQWVRVATQE